MAGFWKRLFGAPDKESTLPSGEPDEVYKDVAIFVMPVQEGGQWRIAGALRKDVDGVPVERKFVRADLLPDQGSAKAAALGKARLIIDQNGDALWRGEERSV
ncbi:MAG: HlyU family transcriptional regulator [Oricola sp.]